MIFKREKVSSLLGHTEVRFTQESNPSGFAIVSSHEGIFLQGASLPIASMEDLQLLAKTISDAWKDHMKLRPKLETSISGH